jgi:hypothetical protein
MILGGQLNAALDEPPSPATSEVATLAIAALEHHLERRLRSVATFEREFERTLDRLGDAVVPKVDETLERPA